MPYEKKECKIEKNKDKIASHTANDWQKQTKQKMAVLLITDMIVGSIF